MTMLPLSMVTLMILGFWDSDEDPFPLADCPRTRCLTLMKMTVKVKN